MGRPKHCVLTAATGLYLGVEWRLDYEDGLILWGDHELGIERVVPYPLHVVPVRRGPPRPQRAHFRFRTARFVVASSPRSVSMPSHRPSVACPEAFHRMF